jgi:CheY-like chemotaxis protein
MPGIDGFELARQAKVMRPSITVVYISGYGDDDRGPTFGEVLQKPVRLPDLLRTVEELPA